MKKIINIIDKTNDFIGKGAAWLVIPLTLIIVLEVICRRIFANPTIWTFEMSSFLYGAHFMLLVAYGLLHNSHVNVTIVSENILSPRVATIIDLILYFVLLIPFVILLILYGGRYALTSWSQLETSWSIWSPPLYPIKTVIPLTGILVLLQAISEILKKIYFLKNGIKFNSIGGEK